MDKNYNPKIIEDKIYQLWLKSGFFNPDKLPKKHQKPYSIVIPPPNITGELHIGHALNAVIQDILIRWKRMQGFKTLWLPGTDHAGIATQNVVEKKLKKEGKTRFDLGRKKFIEEIQKWKKEYGSRILSQFKKMGCSCDWSRTRFTMDKEYIKAVEKAFLHYYKKGLIYQGKRIINWCRRCATSLSDLELKYEEKKANLWYIKYPLKEKGFIIVATTRPETMLGDTAVAVNPKDKRYKHLIKKTVILPLVNREIPIISDRAIDMEFGSGAVKITPAHDPADEEIGRRHKLKSIQVIDEKGQIINSLKKYNGLTVEKAREEIVQDLKNKGFLEKIEEYVCKIPKCDRCNTTIEFIPSLQWFVKMKGLAKLAEKPVKQGKIKFHPKNFEKPYFNWLENIKDWCISRQIWWGHRLPVWYPKNEKQEKKKIYVGFKPPKGYYQVDDVLDTWFSSALWPFASMGWPKKTKDLKKFYPTNVLTTGRDIIYLWVSRMIFSSIEFLNKIPFKDVYINATVLTRDGKRMSKSLGTGIDPLKFIEEYGADAARFGIAYQITGGQDIRFVSDNILMGRKFCNKIWNATRFVMAHLPKKEIKIPIKIKNKEISAADKKILSQLQKTIKELNKYLEAFKFGKAAHLLYNFFWHNFCDIYIEEFKKQMVGQNEKQKEESRKVILYILLNSIIILHPFIPFITEEIYQKLPINNKKKSLMIEKWPQ